ncbi:MAG: aldehyde dehydrogenase, partial [Thermoplasmata archaeon]
MEVSNEQISRLVEEVVRRVKSELESKDKPVRASTFSFSGTDGIFSSLDEAIMHAEKSQEVLLTLGIEKRKEIISSMRKYAIDNAEYLAELAHKETGLGRVKDKVAKNLLAAKKTPGCEDLESKTYTGDDGLTLVEMAPYGVIGSITPTTNPSSTIINNSISMVAAGNAVVFNPHPSAKGVSNETVRILNRAIRAAGGPETLLCSITEPTLETSKALMKHPKIKMLVVTGGGEVVKAAMASGKKVIAAGPGNPPVIVDETANIKNAAKHIVDGASFDNCVLCIAEKEVFAVSKIVDELKEEMKKNGAYEINSRQADELVKVLFKDTNREHPITNKKFVGKDARLILEQIGIHVGPEIRLVITEVDENHPFVYTEM